MRITLLALLVFSFSLVSSGQTAIVYNGGDNFPPTLTSWAWGQSTIEIVKDAGEQPGTGAIKWVQGDEWANGWTGIGFSVDPPFDLSKEWQFESITFKAKCDTGVGALRVQYEDGAGKMGRVFTPIADNQWHTYVFPLSELTLQDGTTEFDASKVNTVGIMSEATAKVGKVIYMTDWYITTKPSLIMFNGMAIPTNMEAWTWGNSIVEVEQGSGPAVRTNSLKWTQAEGATGFGFTVSPSVDLSKVWQADSMKFKLKAEAGADTTTIMFYFGPQKITAGISFKPTDDNQWHDYSFPLRDFKPLGEVKTFDPADIQFVEVNTGLFSGSGKANKVVYFSDWWTGNPVFDVMPPTAPEGLSVQADTFKNVITWTDVKGEGSERYNVYYSKAPITDVSKAELVASRIKEDVQTVEHSLIAPLTDQNVTYYYAVTCTDAAGNTSEPASLPAVTNTAKGVSTVSLEAPAANFAADGDFSEWAAVKPIHIAPSTGAVVATGTTITDDKDLSLDAYVAVDNTYLYVAFDVEDDKVNAGVDSWADDCPDLYIGLYNWHGAPHASFKRGDEPDYHFRFLKDRVLVDGLTNGDSLVLPGANYYWGEKFPTGYAVEARIPLQTIADKFADKQFVPVEGFRIPIDFDIIDSDVPGAREGVMCFSKANDAMSWSSPSYWTYTWVGKLSDPTGVNDGKTLAKTYSLSQNYPNPFNPTTKITYTLEKPGMVTLSIYNILGGLVGTIVSEQQESGLHTVNFDASKLSSGVYFYKINSGTFSSTKKMMLVK